jgi:hypothetical protein
MTKMITPDAVAVPASSRRPQFRLARFRDLALVPAIIVLMVIGALISPDFLTVDNLTNVLQQQSALALLVLAEAMILITGKFDLSLESTIGFAPVLAIALVMPAGQAHGLGTEWPQWMAIPLCLLIGAAIGAFNGLLILKFQLSAFIVTLGMLITVRGLHVGVSGGSSLFQLPQSFMYLGFEKWFGLAASVWIALIAFVIGIVVLSYFRHPGDRPARRDRREHGRGHDLHRVRGGRDRRDQPQRRQGNAVRRALRCADAGPDPEPADDHAGGRALVWRDQRCHHPHRTGAVPRDEWQGSGVANEAW